MYFLQIHQILWRLKNAFIHFAGFLPGFHFCEVPSLRVTLLVNEYASLSTWGAMANHKPATCLANVHWSGDRHDLKIMKMMKGILFHQLLFSAYLVCQFSSVCEVSKINAWPKRPASGVEQTSRCQWVLVDSCGMREANLHVICADSLAQVEKRRKAPGCSSFWWWKKTPCIGRWISKGWRSLFPGCGHQLFSSALVAHVLLRRVGNVCGKFGWFFGWQHVNGKMIRRRPVASLQLSIDMDVKLELYGW